jgi:hypothetical protein
MTLKYKKLIFFIFSQNSIKAIKPEMEDGFLYCMSNVSIPGLLSRFTQRIDAHCPTYHEESIASSTELAKS